MSFLGGIGSSLINPMSIAQLAMGPAGWASLAMKTIGSAIGQQILQQVGQQLGLPQGAINIAQQGLAASTGTTGYPSDVRGAVNMLSDAFNLSPAQSGRLERALNQEVKGFDVNDFMSKIKNAVEKGERESKKSDKTATGGGDFLRIIAEAMSKSIKNKVGEMQKLSQKMDEVKHEKGKSDSVSINTDLQVATQEFTMLMNMSSSMIKALGEGMTTMARKN